MQGTYRTAEEREAFKAATRDVNIPHIQRDEIAPVLDLLPSREDLIVLDIGAHKGSWAAAILRSAPRQVKHIFCVDASPENYRELTRREDNLVLTMDEQRFVSVYPYAMSDEPGAITLHTNDDGSPLASVYQNVLRGWGSDGPALSQKFVIPADTVDNFVERQRLEHVHVLKVDTEGHELSVFKGAKRTLADKRVDVILFEFGVHQVQARNYFVDFFDFFAEHGYRMHTAEHGVLKAIPEYTWEFENLSRLHHMLAVADRT